LASISQRWHLLSKKLGHFSLFISSCIDAIVIQDEKTTRTVVSLHLKQPSSVTYSYFQCKYIHYSSYCWFLCTLLPGSCSIASYLDGIDPANPARFTHIQSLLNQQAKQLVLSETHATHLERYLQPYSSRSTKPEKVWKAIKKLNRINFIHGKQRWTENLSWVTLNKDRKC